MTGLKQEKREGIRKRLPAAVRHEQFREAALHLIAQRGIASLTVRQICAEIGLSTGAFFHYFKSKRDFLDYLVLDEHSFLFEECEPYIQNATTLAELHEGLLTWLRERLSYVRDYTLAFFNWMTLFGTEGLDEMIGKVMAEFMPRFASHYQRLQASGEIRADIEATTLAWMVATVIDDLAFMFFFQNQEVHGGEAMSDLLLQPFGTMFKLIETLAAPLPQRG